MKASIVENTKGEKRLFLELETNEEREFLRDKDLQMGRVGHTDDVLTDIAYIAVKIDDDCC